MNKHFHTIGFTLKMCYYMRTTQRMTYIIL